MSTAKTAPAVHALQSLALALTPSLGPSRGRRLVEHFGSINAVFNASLTELEGAGLSATAAQSVALGKSSELAQEEMVRAPALELRS